MVFHNEEQVVSLISKTFKKLCAGGIKSHEDILGCKCQASLQKFRNFRKTTSVFSTNVSDDGGNDGNRNDWLKHLESLAAKSVSYPNGPLEIDDEGHRDSQLSSHSQSGRRKCNHNRKRARNADDIGKPQDIEIKLALSFFHRYKHRCRQQAQSQSFTLCEASIETEIEENEKRVVPPLEIISDSGLVRSIYSPMDFAKHLVEEMENFIWYEKHETENPMKLSWIYQYSIKSDQSGIICMVTPKRFMDLKNIGRLPCPKCPKWVKGEKGLWWHYQMEHKSDYSMATAMASSFVGVNELSIVVYRGDDNNVAGEHEQTQVDQLEEDNKKMVDPYFQSIKDGNLEQFIGLLGNQHIHDSSFKVALHLDKNGASAVHWAAGCGHLKIVKYLLKEQQCPPDQGQKGKRSFQNRTPLHWAARNGHLEVVKYLVEEFNVNLDAVTIDGTTAFCLSCWQGHVDVMRYLHSKGTNVSSTNSFGCNAVLWSAQSSTSGLDVIQWLKSIELNMGLVNSNGHGMLHKSAQRGKNDVCQWIFETYQYPPNLKDDIGNNNMDLLLQISPDEEGCCPSDLAGMEGFHSLANWLTVKERNIAMEAYASRSSSCPQWLSDGVSNAKHLANRFGLEGLFEKGAGLKKICAHIAASNLKS